MAKTSLQSRSFRHKMMYFGCIVLLMIPMFWLSQPATIGIGEKGGSKGGKLEQLRQESKISSLDIGEVSMAAETVRLGTFGLDGIATMLLWEKANEYKKKKDWTNLSATLKQLILLVPHFETVWRFQGWNLAYNVSVEHDNYKERYDWVIEGIRYLERGTRFNQRSIRLTWDVGWTTSHKMGKSDEKVQFRQLFRQDNDFNKDRALDDRDGWLVGKGWYLKAEELVSQGADLQTISPTLFYSHAPNAQAYYASALQSEGCFDQKALAAWTNFSEEWKAYGEKEIPTVDGDLIRLETQEILEKQAEEDRRKLESLQPGLYESLVAAKREKLTPEERAALDIPEDQWTLEDVNTASEAEKKIRVTNTEWAAELPVDLRGQGMDLAESVDKLSSQAMLVRRYRLIVNYRFWKLQGQLERTPEIMEARKLVYLGDRAFASGDLVTAKNNYDRAISAWATMLKIPEYSEIGHEDLLGSDLREIVDKYQVILNQRNETLPDDFPLNDVIRLNRPTDPVILESMKVEKPAFQTAQ